MQCVVSSVTGVREPTEVSPCQLNVDTYCTVIAAPNLHIIPPLRYSEPTHRSSLSPRDPPPPPAPSPPLQWACSPPDTPPATVGGPCPGQIRVSEQQRGQEEQWQRHLRGAIWAAARLVAPVRGPQVAQGVAAMGVREPPRRGQLWQQQGGQGQGQDSGGCLMWSTRWLTRGQAPPVSLGEQGGAVRMVAAFRGHLPRWCLVGHRHHHRRRRGRA